MNLIKLFHNFKDKLDEINFKRKYLFNKMDTLSYEYTESVCKIFLWNNLQKRTAVWCDEIYNCLTKITELKDNNGKRLALEYYLTNFFYLYLGSEIDLANKLASTGSMFTQKDRYPKPNSFNISNAYKNYMLFVNTILDSVVKNKLNYDVIVAACKAYLKGK